MKKKKIGILTSGGDAPGMNAAIRAVARTAIDLGMQPIGIKKGFNGMLYGNFSEITAREMSGILYKGGTVLGTARCKEFMEIENVKKAVEIAKDYGIEGVVVIGGDGSFRGARDLSLNGMPTVGIPGTIDNDIGCSDYTIGFDTALNTVRDAIDKIRDTTSSHYRCSFIEVMGNKAGYLPLYAGIACGAEVIIIPEKKFDIDEDIINPILECRERGKNHYIVVVAEKCTDRTTSDLAHETVLRLRAIHDVEVETRVTVLGHVQRGGSPTVTDRLNASRMGYYAAKLLYNGIGNKIVAIKNNEVVDYDILEALNMKKEIDFELIEISRILST